jgi:hypothetical protein
MKRTYKLIFISFFFINTSGFAQTNTLKINITPTFGNLVLQLADSLFKANDSTQLQVDVLKFYISKVQLLNDGKIVLEEKNSFHLIDASELKSVLLPIDIKENIHFNELKFDLGLDSTTNVSGAMGGDLDPTKGMYWTWQSGYINFKLEGKSKLCKTRNSEFQFHLGGYQQPNYCVQTLRFQITNSSVINLKLDLKKIFQQIDLAKTNHIMSPCLEAVLLSKIVSNSLTVIEN